MKAILSTRVGGPETLELQELPDPPGAGEVLLAVKACRVNYPDLLIIEDRYQFAAAPLCAGRRSRCRRAGSGTRSSSQVTASSAAIGGMAELAGRPVHRHAAAAVR
jgi:NADPH2:quinone reductase